MITVRFAPSPTGFLHIGGARTALFNWIFAKKHHGRFLLRIEDTDFNRSNSQYVGSILQAMEWLGLAADEPPIYQSQNQPKHIEYAQELLKKGMAYWCGCPPFRQVEDKNNTKHRHVCQGPGDKQVLRIKAPEDGAVDFHDLIRGNISVNASELNDFVILRADNTPVYQFCAPIDDHMMGVTHVIRGDDHITNTFSQLVVYNALGVKPPSFAHLPLIHAMEGGKLSKRHGAISAIEYKEMGILPDALKNYLLSLGFSCEGKEIFSEEEAAKSFDWRRISKAPAKFNMEKLLSLNHHYIKHTPSNALLQMASELYAANNGKKLNDQQEKRIAAGLNGLRERSATLLELIRNAQFYITDNINPEPEDVARHVDFPSLKIMRNALNNLTAWDNEILQNFFTLAKDMGIPKKIAMQSLRIAITGSMQSPGIVEAMVALGKKECLRRINSLIAKNT